MKTVNNYRILESCANCKFAQNTSTRLVEEENGLDYFCNIAEILYTFPQFSSLRDEYIKNNYVLSNGVCDNYQRDNTNFYLSYFNKKE